MWDVADQRKKVLNYGKYSGQKRKLFFMWVGPDQRKKWVHFRKDSVHILDTKKKKKFKFLETHTGGGLLYGCLLVLC